MMKKLISISLLVGLLVLVYCAVNALAGTASGSARGKRR